MKIVYQVGCGNGGLDWETQVRPELEPYLDDQFTLVVPSDPNCPIL